MRPSTLVALLASYALAVEPVAAKSILRTLDILGLEKGVLKPYMKDVMWWHLPAMTAWVVCALLLSLVYYCVFNGKEPPPHTLPEDRMQVEDMPATADEARAAEQALKPVVQGGTHVRYFPVGFYDGIHKTFDAWTGLTEREWAAAVDRANERFVPAAHAMTVSKAGGLKISLQKQTTTCMIILFDFCNEMNKRTDLGRIWRVVYLYQGHEVPRSLSKGVVWLKCEEDLNKHLITLVPGGGGGGGGAVTITFNEGGAYPLLGVPGGGGGGAMEMSGISAVSTQAAVASDLDLGAEAPPAYVDSDEERDEDLAKK